MLSPVKAIVTGALVALGGLFLVAQPFDLRELSAPGAQTTELNGVSVTVTQDCVDVFASPIVCDWTAGDSRLTGTLTHEWVGAVDDPSPDSVDAVTLGWADATLEAPEGEWLGHLYAVWGAEPAAQLFVVLSGEGAYEGWQYVASTIDSGPAPGDSDWYGMLYQGEPLPFGVPLPMTD